jgi:tetratricopeptide (TPR) repeat protein
MRQQGDYSAALKLFTDQLGVARRVNDHLGVALAYNGIGTVLLRQEHYPQALENFQQSQTLNESMADTLGISYDLLNKGNALWRIGRYKESEEALDRARALCTKVGGNPPLLAAIHRVRAETLLSEGRLQDARSALQKIPSSQIDADRETSADVKRLSGMLATSEGRPSDGERECEGALTVARQTGDIGLIQNVQLALTAARLAKGDIQSCLPVGAALIRDFARYGRSASELYASLLIARACHMINNRTSECNSDLTSKISHVHDVLGAQAFNTFLARPDISNLMKTVNQYNARSQ